MTFFIATDHAATDLKADLINHLEQKGEVVTDLTPENNPAEHYAEAADRLCRKVRSGEGMGILLCGTGQGTAMRANRYPGIRAAMVTNEFLTEMARAHNNANVLVMGARVTAPHLATRLLDVFIRTAYEGGRHKPRVAAIDAPVPEPEKQEAKKA